MSLKRWLGSLCILFSCVCCAPRLLADELGAGECCIYFARWTDQGIDPRKPLTPPPAQDEKPKPPVPPDPQNKPGEDSASPSTSGTPTGGGTATSEEHGASGTSSRNENAAYAVDTHFAGFYTLTRNSEPWPLFFVALLVVLNIGAFAAASSLIKRDPGSMEPAPRLASAAVPVPVSRSSAPRSKAAPALARTVREKAAPVPAAKPLPAPSRAQTPSAVASQQAPARVQTGAPPAPRVARNQSGAAMLIRKKKLT